MLPVHPALIGALLSATTRLCTGEARVSESTRERVEVARDHLDDLSDLIGDLSAARPASWGHFAGRLMERSLGTRRRFRSLEGALKAYGFRDQVRLPAGFARRILGRCDDVHRPFQSQGLALYVLKAAPGHSIALEVAADAPSVRVHFPGTTSRDEICRHLADLLWKESPALLLSGSRDHHTLEDQDLSGAIYHGASQSHIEDWRGFLEAGIRRTVLLQGPPGCGKSTFCAHAARELGRRTLMIGPEVLTSASHREWMDLLTILSPDVLIIDDVDRVGSSRSGLLDEKLIIFDERHARVPLTLMTSNDHSRLPAALRRPGRIDQVIELDEPDDETRDAILGQLARRAGVAIPAEELPRLRGILGSFSAAHVVETLRRARIHGWEGAHRDEDSFFLQREYSHVDDWLRVHSYQSLRVETPLIASTISRLAPSRVVYRDEQSELLLYELPNGATCCIPASSRWNDDGIYYRPQEGLRALQDGVAELFWKDRQAALVDAVDRKQVMVQTVTLDSQEYYGSLTECIDDWRAFVEAGLRRTVLLQGPPGCGKSTFCQQAARALSERTLLLTPRFYEGIDAVVWKTLVDFIGPQAVIIDDLDRVRESTLEQNLRLIEEGFCDIPLILLTTNDHLRLPRPMRRPGRIDQIIELATPGEELRRQLVREMAARAGFDEIPELHFHRLVHIATEQSTAHLVEALRRACVLGWSRAFHAAPGDITFSSQGRTSHPMRLSEQAKSGSIPSRRESP